MSEQDTGGVNCGGWSPCPFCGSAAVRESHIRDGKSVGCSGCGANVHAFHPDALAKATVLWNTRLSTSPVEQGWREALEDVATHRAAWRKAIILSRDFASEGSEDPDADISYWNHELRAFDRTFAALRAPHLERG